MLFYDKVTEFQQQYMKNPKYKDSFVKHVPYNSIALGPFLLELPNFSEKMRQEFRLFLNSSEAAFNTAIQTAKSEHLLYEFDFTVVDALRGLAEVCFLQSEYRSRVLEYKYADYGAQDQQRRLNNLRKKKMEEVEEGGGHDDLDDGLLRKELAEGGDEWEEKKTQKEELEVFNYRLKATKYLEAVIATSRAQAEFIDKQHELGQASLTDAAKIPREVISELFEASAVSKVSTSKHPDFEFKDKAAISAQEVLAYTKAVVNECCMLTFGFEKSRLAKLISKLHRYLIGNLPSYQSRCQLAVPEIQEETSLEEVQKREVIKNGHVLGHWFDFQGRASSMFYILGPLDESAVREPEGEETEEAKQQRVARETQENALIHFGQVEVQDTDLSQLYQDTRDLLDKMRASEKLSAEKNTRDRKGYKVTYHKLIERLGNMFKPPASKEEALDQDIDCLQLVENLIPELSIESVERLAEVLQKGTGGNYTDPLMNGILRRFHRVRYVA